MKKDKPNQQEIKKSISHETIDGPITKNQTYNVVVKKRIFQENNLLKPFISQQQNYYIITFFKGFKNKNRESDSNPF